MEDKMEDWMYRCSKRLQRDLRELRRYPMKNFRNLQVDESDIFRWQGLIVPDNPPYDKGAFRIAIVFPRDYPFVPPRITFKTKIYHPSITECGWVCVCGDDSILNRKNWNACSMNQVIQAIIDLLNDPESFGPLGSCGSYQAQEYFKNREAFLKKAEEFTKTYGEERPTD